MRKSPNNLLIDKILKDLQLLRAEQEDEEEETIDPVVAQVELSAE